MPPNGVARGIGLNIVPQIAPAPVKPVCILQSVPRGSYTEISLAMGACPMLKKSAYCALP